MNHREIRDRNSGEMERIVELTNGQRVRDRESDDDTQMLILRIWRESARMNYVDAIDQTVAEANPDYPAHDPVIDVVFIADIEDAVGSDWNADEILRMDADDQLTQAGIKSYAYPVSRLAEVEEETQ